MDAFFFVLSSKQVASAIPAQHERNKSPLAVTFHHRRKLGNIIW
jgi:hypothetical protein